MNLTLIKQIEETVDIPLPVFVKFGSLTKIISDTEYIQVDDSADEFQIRKTRFGKHSIPQMINNGEAITEAAFNNAYQNALSRLTLQSFLDSGISTPATDEEIRAKLDEEGEAVLTEENEAV